MVQQKRECGFAWRLCFEREKAVRAGSAKIDCGHRLSELGRLLDEAEARIDHERRTDDQHGVGPVQVAEPRVDPVAWNILAEEYDVRLEQTAASSARRNDEGREGRPFEVRIAIGRFRRVK